MSTCAAYILEHVATGKCFIGSTKDVKQCMAQHRLELKNGTSKLKNLLELYKRDQQIKEKLFLTDTYKEAQVLEKRFIEEMGGSYLLLNPRPKVKSKPSKKKHKE